MSTLPIHPSPILTALSFLLLLVAASAQPDVYYQVVDYPHCPITGERPEDINGAYIEAARIGAASNGAAVWQRRCAMEDNMTCCGLCGGEELALRYIRSNVSLAIEALGSNATAAAAKLIDLSNPPSACEALQGYPLCAHLLEMVMCTAVCDAGTEFLVEAGPTITICDGLAERLTEECAGTLFGRITKTMDAYSFTTQLLTAIGRSLYVIPAFSTVISFSGECLYGAETDDASPHHHMLRCLPPAPLP